MRYTDFVKMQQRILRDPTVTADVPCGTCTACCHEIYQNQNVAHHDNLPDVDENGACVEVGHSGCTIHADRPLSCRRYDCRLYTFTGVKPDTPKVLAVVERWTPMIKDHDDMVMAIALRMTRDSLVDAGFEGSGYRLAMAVIVQHERLLKHAKRWAKKLRVDAPDEYKRLREMLSMSVSEFKIEEQKLRGAEAPRTNH